MQDTPSCACRYSNGDHFMNIAPYVLHGSAPRSLAMNTVTTHHSLIQEQHFTVFNPITHEAIEHLHSASAQDMNVHYA